MRGGGGGGGGVRKSRAILLLEPSCLLSLRSAMFNIETEIIVLLLGDGT